MPILVLPELHCIIVRDYIHSTLVGTYLLYVLSINTTPYWEQIAQCYEAWVIRKLQQSLCYKFLHLFIVRSAHNKFNANAHLIAVVETGVRIETFDIGTQIKLNLFNDIRNVQSITFELYQ